MPAKIQAVNVTNDTPQVSLLIKITYLTASNLQREEQGEFTLSVPGASVLQQNNLIWLAVVGVVAVTCIGAVAYRILTRKRRAR